MTENTRTPNTVTITDTSEAAKQRTVDSLRRIANALESGATIVSGGLLITNPKTGLCQIDSDLIIRKI